MIPILPAFTAPVNETGTPSGGSALFDDDDVTLLTDDDGIEPLTDD